MTLWLGVVNAPHSAAKFDNTIIIYTCDNPADRCEPIRSRRESMMKYLMALVMVLLVPAAAMAKGECKAGPSRWRGRRRFRDLLVTL